MVQAECRSVVLVNGEGSKTHCRDAVAQSTKPQILIYVGPCNGLITHSGAFPTFTYIDGTGSGTLLVTSKGIYCQKKVFNLKT